MLRFLGPGRGSATAGAAARSSASAASACSGPGSDLADLAGGPRRRPGRLVVRPGEVVHRPVPDGRAAPAFDLGPQARRPGRGPRRVRADRHQRCPGLSIGELLPHDGAGGRQALPAPGDVDRRQRPLVERLLHADRPAAPADERRERQPGRRPTTAPSLGALVGRVAPARGGLPPSVTLPHRIFNTDGSVWPGQDAGFLGRAADPWLLNARLTPEGYRIQEIDLPADLDPARARPPDGPARRLPPRARRARPRPDGAGSSTTRPARRSTCSARPQARRAFRLDDEPEADPRPLRRDRRSARGSCWPAGWSRRGSGWSRSTGIAGPTSRRTTPAGTATSDESARLKDVLVPADRPGLLGPDRGPRPPRACSTRRWWSAWPSSAGAPGSTPTAAGTTGARSSRSPWPAAGSAAARSTARPTRSAA